MRLAAMRAATGLVAAILLAGCATSSTGPRRSSSGTSVSGGPLSGRVLRAPTCPVERIGSPCPPAAAPGAVVAVVNGTRVVAQTSTDRAGHFAVRVPYGQYTVRATNAGPPSTPVTISVDFGPTSAPITLIVDSGIR